MATVIQIKRSSATSAPATLKLGELAYTFGTGTQGNNGDRLFIGEGGVDGNGDANNVTVIGGQYFSDMLDHVAGTLTGSSALIADSNLAIDQAIVGNSATVGGTVKFNEGTNNGTNFIGLKAPNAVTTTTTFTLPDGDGSSGQFLKTDGSGNLSWAASGTASRTTTNASTGSISQTSSANITIPTPGKTFSLLKVAISAPAYVILYTDSTSRSNDASRSEGTDPTPGSGVLTEVSTTTSGASTFLMTPAVLGWNNDSTPANQIYAKVVNKRATSGSNAITVTLTSVALES